MRKQLRLATAVLLVATAAISTSCAPHEDWSTAIDPVWSIEAQLLSEPVRAGDVVLAYAVGSEGAEEIVAWDIDDGTELWRQTALPGRTPRGVAHVVATAEIDGTWMVGILAPRHSRHEIDDWSRFIVLDAMTGAPLFTQLRQTRVWSHRPVVCADDKAFCMEGFRHGDELYHEMLLQYTPGEDEVVPADYDGAPYIDGGFRLSTYISTTDDGQLRYGADGAIVWERPYEDVFGTGADTGAGWAWYDGSDNDDDLDGEFDGDAGLLIGSGATYTPRDLTVAFDGEGALDDGVVVRLDRESGDTVWSIDGAQPCELTDYRLKVVDGVVPLCTFESGSLSWHWDGEEASEVAYHDVDQQLIGVDARSGEVLWTRELGDEPANYAGSEYGGTAFLPADENAIAVIDGTAQRIALATGEAKPFPSDAALLCKAPRDTVELTSIWTDDPTYKTADNYTLCTPQAKAASEGILSRATLAAAGFADDEPAILVTPTGMSLYAAQA